MSLIISHSRNACLCGTQLYALIIQHCIVPRFYSIIRLFIPIGRATKSAPIVAARKSKKMNQGEIILRLLLALFCGSVIGVDLADRLLDRARGKAQQQDLSNVEFVQGDMEQLGYPDGSFNAVISVFSVFFVPDMVKQAAELWRMVKPGGQLAITTWGPRAFEPGAAAFWAAVKDHAPPALHFGGFNPWDRVTTVEAVRELLISAGESDPIVEAEASRQPLRAPADWWTIVIGSGFVWTVDQMDAPAAERVRRDNLKSLETQYATFIETNSIYATAKKRPG